MNSPKHTGRRVITTLLAMALITPLPSYAETPRDEDPEQTRERVVSTRVVSRKVVRRRVVRKSPRRSAKKARAKQPSASAPVITRAHGAQTRPTLARTGSFESSAGAGSASSRRVDKQEAIVPAPQPRNRGTIRLEAMTDVPLQIGAGVMLESKHRLRLRSSLGFISGAYIDGVNAFAQTYSEQPYTDAVAELVSESLENSMVWRTHVGMRPGERAGLYMHAGYTLVSFGSKTTGAELLEAALEIGNIDMSAGPMGAARDVQIDSNLHLVDVELGWDFYVGRHANLRIGAGYSHTFFSRTRISARYDADNQMNTAEIQEMERNGEVLLDAIYQEYLRFPTVSMAFGLRF